MLKLDTIQKWKITKENEVVSNENKEQYKYCS